MTDQTVGGRSVVLVSTARSDRAIFSMDKTRDAGIAPASRLTQLIYSYMVAKTEGWACRMGVGKTWHSASLSENGTV